MLGIEFDLPGCLLIKPFYASNGREDCASGKKITVADVAKYCVFGPFRVFEAFVRRAGRRWFAAKQMSQCPRPQADALFPKLELRARDRSRIGHKLGCQLKEGLTDLGRIAHADIGHVWSVYEESLYRSLAFCRQRLKSFRQNSGIHGRRHFIVACHGSHSLSRSPYAGPAIYLPPSRYATVVAFEFTPPWHWSPLGARLVSKAGRNIRSAVALVALFLARRSLNERRSMTIRWWVPLPPLCRRLPTP